MKKDVDIEPVLEYTDEPNKFKVGGVTVRITSGWITMNPGLGMHGIDIFS